MAIEFKDVLDTGEVDSNVTNAVKRHGGLEISDTDGLQTALDDKANSTHHHQPSDIDGFDSAVSGNTDVAANTGARHTHTNKTLLDSLTAAGSGGQFLADDGTYKPPPETGARSFTELDDTPSDYSGAGGYTVKVNTEGTGLVFASGDAGGSPSGIVVDRFTGDGTTAEFTTSATFDIPTVMVLLNGIALVPGEDVDVSSGTSVVFSTAPDSGDSIAVYMVVGEVGIGVVEWGNITGTLSSQTDLQAALDLKVSSDTSAVANSNQVSNMVYMTQADYDALGSYDAATLYVIVG